MIQPTANIAALIGSRICHDLISPVGAISNGLELMALVGTPDGPEFSLVNDSASNASARIRFFRIAFGHATAEQSVSEHEINAVLNAIYTGLQRVEWLITGAIPRPQARLAFLSLMCLEQVIPRGGVITVTSDGVSLRMTATGTALNIRDDHWDLLSTLRMPEDLPPAQVQFALLPLVALEHGVSIATEVSDDSLTIAL